MKKALALLAATMLSAPAFAAPVGVTVSGYTISYNTGSDGLTIMTQKIMSEPYAIPGGLEPGGPSKSEDLFLIWTPEAQANWDDYDQMAISLTMTISAPAAGNGGIGGYTTTVNVGGIFNRVGLGVLEWDNNGIFDIAFGFNNTGLLRVDLNDANFNQGSSNPGLVCKLLGTDCDLNGGIGGGDIVDATFTLIRDADDNGNPNEVPEPATLGLLGMGVLGIAGARRRKAA